MDILKLFRGAEKRVSASVQDDGGGRMYSAIDPEFLAAIRASVSGRRAGVLLNGAVNRSVRLLSQSIGMLPVNLHWKADDKGVAADHSLHHILHLRPNNWQTPFEFKRLMEAMLLRRGVSYAQIVKSRGVIIQLQPLAKYRVEAKQNLDWTITYELTSPNGVSSKLRQDEVFALRDLDIDDGVGGSSRIDQASDAIKLTSSAKSAAMALFENGMNVGGALSTPGKLSDPARKSIKESMAEKTGTGNTGKWLLLEEGLKPEKFAQTLDESLQVDNLNAAIEEICRIFGVPRPLMMMDETSWGSGIDALGLFFIQYGLAPEFVNWEQAIQRDLMTDDERLLYVAKFNDGALLRGSLKDQAEFFAKALGSGGSQGWMKVNEVRKYQELPSSADGDVIPARQAQTTGEKNVPANPA